MRKRPGNDEQVLQKKVEDILRTHRVSKYIEYEITKKISYDKVYKGHGSREISLLNPLQKEILNLMEVPESIYSSLGDDWD